MEILILNSAYIFARILEIVLISFFFKKEKTLLEMRYTSSGWQARVSEISKKLKIAQKPKQNRNSRLVLFAKRLFQ